MGYSQLYKRLFSDDAERGIWVLLDPDRVSRDELPDLVRRLSEMEMVKALLIGTSLLLSHDFDAFVKSVKENSILPVILFPGGVNQVSRHADGILFLSLVSGRNAELLIGEQVRMAPLVRHFQLDAIPTAYMLIESGGLPSVEFITNTMPIPRDKHDIAVAHAMAAELLGFQLIYLEAGSGAKLPVPPELISEVVNSVKIPVIVGGGLRDRDSIKAAFDAGARYVVVGTAIEQNKKFLEEL